jgi:hypothetical protein
MQNYSISYWGLNLEKPQLSQLNPLPAAHVFSLSQSPEEEALTKILGYAKTIRLSHAKSRLFGRNIYPTHKPEPHGYEYYLTGEDKIKLDSTVGFGEVNGGLHAVLEIKNLFKLTEGWKTLLSWVEANGHAPVGVVKGPHGWVNSAYEERLDWQLQKPPTEWLFRLWVQLRE